MNSRFKLQRIATLLAVITLTLVLMAGVTGILLAFYYEPTAGGAYESLRFITELVPAGGLVHGLHSVAGNGLVLLAILQILVMFFGRRTHASWFVAWVSGFALTVSAVALGWTAMILNWNQLGFWRLKVELGTLQTLPVVGSLIRSFLTGGGGIGSFTVQHMYTLHSYVLSTVALILAVVHLGSLLYQERQSKLRQALDETIAPDAILPSNPEMEPGVTA